MKKSLYVILIVLIAFGFYQKMTLNDMTRKVNEISKQGVMDAYYRDIAQKERVFLKNKLNDIEFVNSNGDKTRLQNKSENYRIYLIASLERCSTCRESVLKLWQDLYNRIPELPLTIIFSEQKPVNKMQLKRYRAYLKGGSFTIPFICDSEGILLTDNSNGLPVIAIADEQNRLVAVNIVDENFKKKNADYSNFAISLVNEKRRFAYNGTNN